MTYTYECPNCGRFEIEQSIKDNSLKECPSCNSPIKKIITGGAGVVYKCGGFYSKPIANIKENKST
jgi:putative FmdB family regulatory protein